MALILDTGPIIASVDTTERYHRDCKTLIDDYDILIVPEPVIVEADHFIRTRLNRPTHLQFLRDIVDGAFRVEAMIAGDYARVLDLCEKYSDLGVGFVDAAVLAIVERLNEPKLATLDHRHFGVMRPRHVESLQLLPG